MAHLKKKGCLIEFTVSTLTASRIACYSLERRANLATGRECHLLPGMNKEFFASCIHSKDLLNEDCIADKCDAAELAQRCETVARWGFAALKFESILIKGKIAHRISSTQHAVVLRGLKAIIRRTARIKPADRDTIVRQLITVLQEGTQYRVYKFDIKSFFESLDTASLLDIMASMPAFPRSALRVLRNYLAELKERGVAGLPRGISLSATLAELALSGFDKSVSDLSEVYFHARYVDDIVIVTGARETPSQFVGQIKRLLKPLKLTLNPAKTKIINIAAPQKSDTGGIVGQFDYLGYSFSIHESTRNSGPPIRRDVDVGIAKAKCSRLKTRLHIAVREFLKDGEIGNLEQRLQILTGNYNLRDFATGRERNIGLYCNYRRVNCLQV